MAEVDEADVIVIADAGGLGEAAWRGIERAASAGKGLVMWLGEDSDRPPLRRVPAEVFRRARRRRYVRAGRARREARGPLLRPPDAQGLRRRAKRQPRRRARLPVADVQSQAGGAAAGQLARIEGGGPAILAAAVDEGRAVVVAFAPSNDSTDLQLRSPFVPLVHEMVRYAAGAGGELTARLSSCEVGSSVSFPMEVSPAAAEVAVVSPLDTKPATFAVPAGRRGLFLPAVLPRQLSVRIPGPAGVVETGFSVNAPLAESLGDRVERTPSPRAIRNSVVAASLSDKPLRRVWGKTRGARELFDIFLVATLAVLALEEYLANRSRRAGEGRKWASASTSSGRRTL